MKKGLKILIGIFVICAVSVFVVTTVKTNKEKGEREQKYADAYTQKFNLKKEYEDMESRYESLEKAYECIQEACSTYGKNTLARRQTAYVYYSNGGGSKLDYMDFDSSSRIINTRDVIAEELLELKLAMSQNKTKQVEYDVIMKQNKD